MLVDCISLFTKQAILMRRAKVSRLFFENHLADRHLVNEKSRQRFVDQSHLGQMKWLLLSIGYMPISKCLSNKGMLVKCLFAKCPSAKCLSAKWCLSNVHLPNVCRPNGFRPKNVQPGQLKRALLLVSISWNPK